MQQNKHFWGWVIVSALLLSVGFSALAQDTFTFDDAGVTINNPTGAEVDEGDIGEVYYFTDNYELAVLALAEDNSDLEPYIEEAYELFDVADFYDASNSEADGDALFNEATIDDATNIAVVAIGREDVVILMVAFLFDGDETGYDALFEVFESISIVSSSSSSDSSSDSDMSDDGDMSDMSFDDILDEFGLADYEQPIIPEEFAPVVNTFSEFVFSDCLPPVPVNEVQGDTMECGILRVPENRTVADSNIIELPVIILFSSSDSPAPDPLIYLEGGPGGQGTGSVDAWASGVYRTQHDIVLFDQRGTGYAQPSLNCPELEFNDSDNPTQDCYDRLVSEGIDLTGYNSWESSYDIRALRDALGADEVALYGISYGTRLALTTIREQGDILSKVIIDANYPPVVDSDVEAIIYADRAFDVLFESCANDNACNTAYPNLETRFFEKLAELDENPGVGFDPNFEGDIEVTGADFLERFFQSLYSTDIIPALPAAADAVATGDYSEALDLITFGSPDIPEPEFIDFDKDPEEGLDDSEGMFASVECNEEFAFLNPERYLEGVDALYGDSSLRPYVIDSNFSLGQFADCQIWNSGIAAVAANEPVVSDIPTLIFAGDHDPVTPPEWGQVAADTLSNSYFYTFPYSGHGVPDYPCPSNIAMQFLADPMSEPDASCIVDMTVDYYIR